MLVANWFYSLEKSEGLINALETEDRGGKGMCIFQF